MNKIYTTSKTILVSLFVTLASLSVQAEVIEQSPNSFKVEHSFTVNADYTTAVHEFSHIGNWWTSEYALSGNGNNLFFDKSGLHENMPKGEVFTHMTKVEKGIWKGALGQLKNASGVMKVRVKAFHHETTVTMEYAVTSVSLSENKHWVEDTDTLIGAQMASLKKSIKNRKSKIRTIIR